MNIDQNTFTIIEVDGRQHKVKLNTVLHLHKIDKPISDTVHFDRIIMNVFDGIEKSATRVTGLILKHLRGEKINIIKFKRRKHHLKRRGFKAHLTAVKITEIQ